MRCLYKLRQWGTRVKPVAVKKSLHYYSHSVNSLRAAREGYSCKNQTGKESDQCYKSGTFFFLNGKLETCFVKN